MDQLGIEVNEVTRTYVEETDRKRVLAATKQAEKKEERKVKAEEKKKGRINQEKLEGPTYQAGSF